MAPATIDHWRLAVPRQDGAPSASTAFTGSTPDVTVRQLEFGAVLDARLGFRTLADLSICTVSVNSAASVQMQAVSAYRVLLPSDGQAEAVVGGGGVHDIDPVSGLVLGPCGSVELITRGRFAQFAVLIPPRLVHSAFEPHHGAVSPVDFAPTMDLSSPAGKRWRDLIALVAEGSASGADHRSAGLPEQQMQRLLVSLLVRDQPHLRSRPAQRTPPTIVERAVDAIEQRPERRWTVEELASTVPCGVRTLQASFHKTLGVTPTEYLRRVRLQRVHDELVSSTAGIATVTDVAMSWGFSHMGRFSAAYHREFAEYPNETLRGSQRDR